MNKIKVNVKTYSKSKWRRIERKYVVLNENFYKIDRYSKRMGIEGKKDRYEALKGIKDDVLQ